VHQLTNHQDITGFTALHVAARKGSLDLVEMLIQHKSKVNVGDNDGYTPLHTASFGAHTAVAETLLKHCAEVNKADVNGYTPLHCVVMGATKAADAREHMRLSQVLMEAGANPKLCASCGRCAHDILPDSLASFKAVLTKKRVSCPELSASAAADAVLAVVGSLPDMPDTVC